MEFPITIDSQEAFDEVVKDRLSRERSKFADYGELKQRVDAAEAEMATAVQERDAALIERDEATGKVQAYQAEQQVNDWRADVAREKGVPADILRGSTKEEFEAHAEMLKPLITARGPVIPGQGEIPEVKRPEPAPGIPRLAEAFDNAIENN